MKTFQELFKSHDYKKDEFVVYNFYKDKLSLSNWEYLSYEDYIQKKRNFSSIKNIIPSVFSYDIKNNKFVSVGYNCRYSFETVTVEGGKVVGFLRNKIFGSYLEGKEGSCVTCGGYGLDKKTKEELLDTFLGQIRVVEYDPETLEEKYLYNMARPLSIVKIDAKTNMPIQIRKALEERIEDIITDEFKKELPSDFSELFDKGYMHVTDPSKKDKGLLEITLYQTSLTQ